MENLRFAVTNYAECDGLQDATADLPADKLVTYEDAFKVIHAELRGRNVEDLQPGGVGATLIAAADLNEQSGLFTSSDKHKEMFLDVDEQDDGDAVGDELRKYQKIDSTPADPTEKSQVEKPSDAPADLTKKTEGTEEETTPLVNSGTYEKVPSSHGSEELPAPTQTEEKLPAPPKQTEI